MALTGEMVAQALRAIGGLGGQMKPLDQLAAEANQALADVVKSGQQVNAKGAAVFLANCAVESAYFRTTREYGGANTRYAPYYGRGFIQVTWRENYAKFGQWCKAKGFLSDANTFVNSPDKLAADKWAWLGAMWYFETTRGPRGNLWVYGNSGDDLNVGIAINRGPGKIGSGLAPYGWDHRRTMYNAFLKFGNQLLPRTEPTEEEELMAAKDDIIKELKAYIDKKFAEDQSKKWADFTVERNGKPIGRSVRQAILYAYEYGMRNSDAIARVATAVKAVSTKVGAETTEIDKVLANIGKDVDAIEKKLDSK